jgi:hypothetical protein
MELHIYAMKENSFSGNAYSYYDKDRYTKMNFSGSYNASDQQITITENSVLNYNIPSNCIPCIKTYFLKLSSNGSEFLDGEWSGRELGTDNECPSGQVHLTKSTKPVFPVEVFQNDSLVILQRALNLAVREKEMVQEIRVRNSDVKLSLIDNGDIDGDTVTVFLNNTLLIHHRALSRDPILLDLHLFPDTDYDLVIYADNQGLIPPNTSLMTITCGEKRHELRMSSNERKSATVRFRYEQ